MVGVLMRDDNCIDHVGFDGREAKVPGPASHQTTVRILLDKNAAVGRPGAG